LDTVYLGFEGRGFKGQSHRRHSQKYICCDDFDVWLSN